MTFVDALSQQLPPGRLDDGSHANETTMESAGDEQGDLTGITTHQQGGIGQGTLQQRLDQLTTDLMLFEQSMIKHDGMSTQFNRHAVQKLLTTSNFDKAVDAIFRREHPTFPLVHRPTFDPNTCTLPLLLSVFLAGYIHTSPSDLCPKVTGIAWIDLFEEYVFSDQNFSSLVYAQRPDHADKRQEHLEEIIAAVVITYLQLGSADTRTRYRMHHQRFPAVLEAARSINLFDSVHITAAAGQGEEDWRRWISDEMAIRTSAYLFFLDCELATFYRVLPHLAIAEMRSAIPSSEAAFAAPEAHLWHKEVFPISGKEAYPLRAVASMLMSHDATTNVQAWGNVASIHGLLQALCALHHLIFTSQANYIMQHMRPPLQQALSTWKVLWDGTALNGDSTDNVSELQYSKFGTQFYWLAQALLDPGSTYPENASADMLAEIHDLLRI